MPRIVSGLMACFLTFSACLSAVELKGKITIHRVPRFPARRSPLVNRVGVVAQTTAGASGSFLLDAPQTPGHAAGGRRPGISAPAHWRSMRRPACNWKSPRGWIPCRWWGPPSNSPLPCKASSVDVIPSGRVRSSNEPFAMDLLRYIPGVAFNQTGSPGGLTSLFLRGGNSNLNLVQIDGVPVNSFGGGFDFAHIPMEAVDHVDFIRGAQSAVYGSYANAGAIDFVTRRPESAPQLSLLAEGGSHSERRFGITGTGTVAGFGLLLSASRYDSDGVVANNDYRNEDVLLNLTRRFGRQSRVRARLLRFQRVGRTGPLRLQSAAHLYRDRHWSAAPRITFPNTAATTRRTFRRACARNCSAAFFCTTAASPAQYGFSFNKDLRGTGRGAHDRQPVAARHGFLRCFGRPRVGAKQLYYGCRLLDISDRAQ